MSDDDYRLQKRIENIKNQEKLSEKTKDFLLNDYLNEVQRSGADKKNTQELYLRRLKKILIHEKLETPEIQALDTGKLKKLNKEIVQNIQDSKYKTQKGEYSVRTKRGFYGAWKRMLQAQGFDTGEYQDYMPNNVSFSSDRAKVDKKKKTTAEDLPDTGQVKQFVKTLGEISSDSTKLRNQVLIGLIWDIGARIGEVIEDDELSTIKMGQVSVNGKRVHIKVKGNKNKSEKEEEASNRRVEVFQFRKMLKTYIENHSKRNDPEAFLFPPDDNNQHNTGRERFYTAMSKGPLRRKIHKARRKAGLDFKTRNEPFHIFRKAMITYYVMNDILSWEKVCERTGKDPSSTMPIYLKMAMQDINAQAAEGFGLEDETRDKEHRMIGPALLPKQCPSCGKENFCIKDVCSTCGHELPESDMPKNMDVEKDPKEEVKEFATQAGGVTEKQLENLIEAKLKERENR